MEDLEITICDIKLGRKPEVTLCFPHAVGTDQPFDEEDFMFEVTWDELSRCQIDILNKECGNNIKYLPFAFTELGIAKL